MIHQRSARRANARLGTTKLALAAGLSLAVASATFGPERIRAQAFGTAVAVVDGRVVAGEPSHEREPGTVRVYAFDGEWAEVAKLQAPEASLRDGFGAALARAGDHLLVGAIGSGADAGRVHVYDLDDLDGGPVQTLASSDLGGFGRSIAASDARLAVAGFDPAGDPAIETYRRGANGRWVASGAIRPFAGADDRSGVWFDVSDDVLVVASRAAGTVEIREPDGPAWGAPETVAPAADSEAGSTRRLALGVAASAGEALVGWGSADRTATIAIDRYAKDAQGWSRAGRTSVPSLAPASLALALATDGSFLAAGGGARIARFRRSGGDWVADGVADLAALPSARPSVGALAVEGAVAVAGMPAADFGMGALAAFADEGASTTPDLIVVDHAPLPAVSGGEVPCSEGTAAGYDCDHVDLLSFLPRESLGASRGARLNDVWGWTDPLTGREYAILGRMDGTAFVDVTDPYNPRYLGNLAKTEGSPASTWRDAKVFRDHAFIVADGAGEHGMQVFDLRQLRDVREPREFEPTVLYRDVASSHNVAINEETGYAYLVGSSDGGVTCGGGAHIVDVNDPTNPTFVGCFAHPNTGRRGTGSTHDAHCVVYRGPDEAYVGREICVSSNETALSVADVTDKDDPVPISAAAYPNVAYAHQGWLTEDHRHFYSNDELDEVGGLVEATRTLIWDLEDLDDPVLVREYASPTRATDHNLYVRGDRLYMSNNRAGLRVLDIGDPENPVELGSFDTTPWSADEAGFDGTWSVYPYFESGSVLLSSRREGLFVVRPRARRLIP